MGQESQKSVELATQSDHPKDLVEWLLKDPQGGSSQKLEFSSEAGKETNIKPKVPSLWDDKTPNQTYFSAFWNLENQSKLGIPPLPPSFVLFVMRQVISPSFSLFGPKTPPRVNTCQHFECFFFPPFSGHFAGVIAPGPEFASTDNGQAMPRLGQHRLWTTHILNGAPSAPARVPPPCSVVAGRGVPFLPLFRKLVIKFRQRRTSNVSRSRTR
eukprot:EG_transcript_4752